MNLSLNKVKSDPLALRSRISLSNKRHHPVSVALSCNFIVSSSNYVNQSSSDLLCTVHWTHAVNESMMMWGMRPAESAEAGGIHERSHVPMFQ